MVCPVNQEVDFRDPRLASSYRGLASSDTFVGLVLAAFALGVLRGIGNVQSPVDSVCFICGLLVFVPMAVRRANIDLLQQIASELSEDEKPTD